MKRRRPAPDPLPPEIAATTRRAADIAVAELTEIEDLDDLCAWVVVALKHEAGSHRPVLLVGCKPAQAVRLLERALADLQVTRRNLEGG